MMDEGAFERVCTSVYPLQVCRYVSSYMGKCLHENMMCTCHGVCVWCVYGCLCVGAQWGICEPLSNAPPHHPPVTATAVWGSGKGSEQLSTQLPALSAVSLTILGAKGLGGGPVTTVSS
jgi:hypothetical protein